MSKTELGVQKELGQAPDWLDETGFKTLQSGYLLKGETVNQAVERVCHSAASHLNRPDLKPLFIEAVQKNWACFASPIWANAGTERGLPISCNSIHIGDSISSIFKKNTELAMLTKHGAGVGIYMGDVRGRGANITGNGRSDGIIPWVKVLSTTTDSVSQGCYDDQTEILTNIGWVHFADLPSHANIKVAQVNDNNKTEFVNYTDYIKYHTDDNLYHFKNDLKSIDMLVTGNHNMVIEKRRRISNVRDSLGKFKNHKKAYTNKLELITADKIKLHRDVRMYSAAESAVVGSETLSALDQLAIAYQADGSTNPSGNSNGNHSGSVIYNFRFAKERKINRLISILDKIGYHYTISTDNANCANICVRYPLGHIPSKLLSDTFKLDTFTKSFADSFIHEISLWDGHNYTHINRGISYSSVNKANVDFVQAVGVIGGYLTNFDSSINRDGNRQDLHNVAITLSRGTIGCSTLSVEQKAYSGYVYCVSVPSKKIIVRRNRRTLVCGNSTRRGAAATYLPVEHSDIEDFLLIRRATGDHNLRARNMNIGVCIGDDFMNSAIDGDPDKRKLWYEILKERFETGEPYLFFTDNVNRQKPESYVRNNLDIKTSNICNEIYQYTDPDHTFVCCLSSLNVDRYDEWKDFKFSNGMTLPYLLTFLLDGVMSEYIAKASKIEHFECAVRSAEKGRALGLGVLGFHSYFQRHMIDMESTDAFRINNEVFKFIDKESLKASQDMAKEFGEPEWCKGLGIRNTLRIAVAPTASNSTISGGISPGIEPIAQNIINLKTAKGNFIKHNRDLKKLLEARGIDNQEVWTNIINDNGSVRNVKQLSPEEKAVFKTAREMNQHTLIKLASQRQKYIDQGQSLNLFFTSNSDARYIAEVHMAAWTEGLKGLYYCRSETPLSSSASYRSPDECLACEG